MGCVQRDGLQALQAAIDVASYPTMPIQYLLHCRACYAVLCVCIIFITLEPKWLLSSQKLTMKKNCTIFFVIQFAFISFVRADVDIKLLCTVDLSIFQRGEQPNRSKVITIVEVYESGKYLSLIADNPEAIPSVSTTTRNGGSYTNYSDSNKWDLRSISYGKKGAKMDDRLTIDRNTGRIVSINDYDNGAILGRAEGFCEKVNATKKKF